MAQFRPCLQLHEDEYGQTAVEYALVIGSICLLMVGILAAAAPVWVSSLATDIAAAIETVLS